MSSNLPINRQIEKYIDEHSLNSISDWDDNADIPLVILLNLSPRLDPSPKYTFSLPNSLVSSF